MSVEPTYSIADVMTQDVTLNGAWQALARYILAPKCSIDACAVYLNLNIHFFPILPSTLSRGWIDLE